MPSDYDSTEFVDSDFLAPGKGSHGISPGTAPASKPLGSATQQPLASRPPSREEVEGRVTETQQKLAELKRVQEELERERASLEDTRRRQSEYTTGRKEALEQITRAVGLLTEAEFALRQDAEQMTKTLVSLNTAFEKVDATQEQNWTRENFQVELTRALTILENARMELNSARLKFPLLTGNTAQGTSTGGISGKNGTSRDLATGLQEMGLGQLCKLGLAMTWPLALAVLAVGILLVLAINHR